MDVAEAELADELRSCCTHYGVEKAECLDTTATLLWKIGKIYLEKADLTLGIVQKLSLIRCAVLLYAAQSRFRITQNECKLDEILSTIADLQAKLERYCGCKPKTSLNEMSLRLCHKVNGIRNRAQNDLDGNIARRDPMQDKVMFRKKMMFFLMREELVLDNNDERNLSRNKIEEEQAIITVMHTFMDNITKQYISLLCEIADECLRILPKPPCNFCIVGLGSLARGEVTMYSDFEHIILLDVNSNDSYEEVVEYFRWYSVLFQIIVVGMGETIIPSVTIPSLNDAYCGDPSRNWFYDKYTPRGISFDGMLPHSCNIPLGRQQTTAKRTHTVELIQTPKMMASFLSYGECEKNGYYLGEVLRQTCFVYGAEDIYNAFVLERRQVLDTEVSFSKEKYLKFVVNNSNADVRDNWPLPDATSFDAKNSFYRPVVTLLAFLGQQHNIVSISSFDLLEQLLEIGAIDKTFHHDLCYALAAACEMRWKLYLLTEQQRHSADLAGVLDTVGENAVYACKSVLPKLRSMISGEEIVDSVPDAAKEILLSISRRGNYEEAIRFGERVIEQYNREGKDSTFFRLKVFFNCYEAGCASHAKRAEYWKKAEYLYQYTFCGTKMSYVDALTLELAMSIMYYTQGRFEKSMEQSRNYFEANRLMLKLDGKIHHEFAPNFQQYHELAFQTMTLTQAEIHLKDIWDDPSIAYSLDCQFTKRYYKALLLALKKPEGEQSLRLAKTLFRGLSLDAKMKASKLRQPRRFLITVIFRQITYFWLDDAVRSIEYIEHNPAPAFSQYELALVEENCIEILKFFCYCRLGMYKEALLWAESSMSVDHDLILLERLMRGLISKLWARLQSQTCPYGNKERTLILLYLIQFSIQEKTDGLFSSPMILGRSEFLLHYIDRLENYYRKHFGTAALQALKNIHCVILLMLVTLPQFKFPL